MGCDMVAITCCVNYADFLAATWSFNRLMLSNIVVVTSPCDYKTQTYCIEQAIPFIMSDCYKQDGSKFNRAAMLNRGIEYAVKMWPGSWYAIIDCDVIIDHIDNLHMVDAVGLAGWCDIETRKKVSWHDTLDRNLIYGCPRKMIEPAMIPDKSAMTIQQLRDPRIGYWFEYPYNLCAYLGYFQMFAKPTARCDESYKTVDNSDTAFLDQNFGINSARTFNDLVCYHLGENGKNWNGRITGEWK